MEELYNKLLLVSLRTSSREERRVRLRTTVAVHSQQARGKELYVRLTDDDDPFFLFTLQLGEDDFQSLKSQQGLLVDFGAFPQNFIDLLNFCLQEENKDLPKFLLTFTISDHDCGVSYLNVVETNSFKHLTHLSLKFLLGNDVDVKKYLAGCLTTLKEESRQLKQKLHTTETDCGIQINKLQQALEARNQEIFNLKEEFSNKSNSLINKHSQELTSEKERVLQVQSSCQERVEKEKRELLSSHKEITQELQNKLSKLSVVNAELNETKLRSESCIRELRSKLGTLEKEYQRSKMDATSLRRDNASLDMERHERDKTLNHLRTRIAVLEQEVKDNQEVITRTKELLEVANEQNKKSEESLAEKQQKIHKSDKTVKSISEELLKANEIILRFQKDLRNAKAKNKMNGTVVTQQEKVISEKHSVLEKQEKQIAELQHEIKQKESEVKTLSASLESANEKLEENKQVIKTNENVINWLNKQMNEQCVTQSKCSSVRGALRSVSNSNLVLPHSTPVSGDSGIYSTQSYVPRYSSQSQVVYRPGQNTDLRTPVIPEEKENVVPSKNPEKDGNSVIDPKYLSRAAPKPLPQTTHVRTQNIPTGPPPTRSIANIPLMSAYFPNNHSPVERNNGNK